MKPVLPSGWLRAFMDKVDLDSSHDALNGVRHFHARTMQGRIRSYQLRFAEAREAFARAMDASRAAPASIPTQIRKLILHVYRFENAVLETSLPGDSPAPDFELPSFPEEVHREYPELQLAINLRTCAEGLFRLHTGDAERAVALYGGLIERGRDQPRSVLASYYLGLAAGQMNLGQVEAARKSFEDCGLCIAMDSTTLTRLSTGAALVSGYTCLGDADAAESWRFFLERVECPAATRDAFLGRARLLVDRWQTAGRLVVW